ncbi:hypothetical protein CPB86DRAFT_829873 [Serendipita vermifera]|nr:hypothetical protein CPB86DRAFT_829873 [Serendipita vermifera]
MEAKVSEWEKVAQMAIDGAILEENTASLASYTGSIIEIRGVSRETDAILTISSSLESALEEISQSPSQERYDLLIRLAKVYESQYQGSKNSPDMLLRGIQYWEDAYGLSVILRLTKEAANEVLPNLAKAYLVAFQDEVSNINALHKAIDYYQIALVHSRPELPVGVQLELGKAYLELMYHANELENARLAISCCEVVLNKSRETEELLEASNGKSKGWWWILAIQGPRKLYQENEEYPFQIWTRSVAATYPQDTTAVCYYALSFVWIEEGGRENLVWFYLAWSLLKSKRQSPPPIFHHFYFMFLYIPYWKKEGRGNAEFLDLPTVLSALEHLELFVETASLKDFYIIQRVFPAAWKLFPQTHSIHLDESQWNAWKRETINFFLAFQKMASNSIKRIYGEGNPFDLNAVVASHESLAARLEARLIRPRNSA